MSIPNFKEFITEGMLSAYKAEKEGKKLTYDNLVGTFDVIISKLIEERIPFYFDCTMRGGYQRVGYLMHNTINGDNFNGYILDTDDDKGKDNIYKEFNEKVLPNIVIVKPGKLHIGRTSYADLTQANDIETISIVVKAFKAFAKDKGFTSREVTGNKYEAHVNIDFLCDRNTVNNIIDFVF
jgi:hypothetical protein